MTARNARGSSLTGLYTAVWRYASVFLIKHQNISLTERSPQDRGLCKFATQGLSLPNDGCSSDLDCKKGYCNGEVCVGKTAGDSCNTTEDCDPQYGCSPVNQTCVARVPDGVPLPNAVTCNDIIAPLDEPTCRDREYTVPLIIAFP